MKWEWKLVKMFGFCSTQSEENGVTHLTVNQPLSFLSPSMPVSIHPSLNPTIHYSIHSFIHQSAQSLVHIFLLFFFLLFNTPSQSSLSTYILLSIRLYSHKPLISIQYMSYLFMHHFFPIHSLSSQGPVPAPQDLRPFSKSFRDLCFPPALRVTVHRVNAAQSKYFVWATCASALQKTPKKKHFPSSA